MAGAHKRPTPDTSKHAALVMGDHQCIGCVAGRHDVAAPVSPALLPPEPPHARPMAPLTGLAYSPATPPPRT